MNESEIDRRINAMVLFVLIVLLLFVFRLGYLQLFHGAYYLEASNSNRIRQIPQLDPRGEIIDSQGLKLATNEPGFFVSMYPNLLKDARRTVLERLVSILNPDGSDLEITVEKFEARLYAGRFRRWSPVRLTSKPLKFSDRRILQIEEQRLELPSVIIDVQPVRSYPFGTAFSHLLGAVGKYTGSLADLSNLHGKGLKNYTIDSIVGRMGLELVFEFVSPEMSLKGTPGQKVVEVDSTSRIVAELDSTKPVPGNNIHLTIDGELQIIVERWIENYYIPEVLNKFAKNASEMAVVALDPKTGKVLAWISHPNFSPATLFFDSAAYAASASDKISNPLVNKVVTAYAPGSIFKPVMAIAGLKEGVIDAKTRYYCGGRVFDALLGPLGKPCWSKDGHGSQDLTAALKNSCNIFFYEIGLRMYRSKGSGTVLDSIANTAGMLGLGLPTNVYGLHGSVQEAGVLPTTLR
ncbi:MAG: penicillin-binding transpeptidase domain-containing protein, partial [bacterium]|nr:penicillin-binding transpeptidase domain-containing protein [bacterium]